MKHLQFFSLLSLLLFVALAGCGQKKPADFPEVQPFTVKVVDGDKPIEGVQVLFIYDKNPVISGLTDSKGVATITTMLQKFTAKGAPAGDYKIQCTKEPIVDHWKTPEEQAQMSKSEKDAYIDEWLAKCAEQPREIPKIWSDYDKTPLTASVPVGGGEVTFDVDGKATN